MMKNESSRSRAFLAWLLPLRCVVFLLIFLAGSFITGKELEEITNWWSVTASLVNILTVGVILAAAKRAGVSYGELMHYEKGKTGVKKTILLVIGIVVIGMSMMYLSGLICYGAIMPAVSLKISAPIPVALAVINMVMLPLTVPFAEDGLYLGCGVGSIQNKYGAILVPAFFYTFQHCFIPVIFDVRYMLYRFLSFLPLTILLCWHFRKYKEPVPIMIGHGVLDLATAVIILMFSVAPGLYEKWSSMV